MFIQLLFAVIVCCGHLTRGWIIWTNGSDGKGMSVDGRMERGCWSEVKRG